MPVIETQVEATEIKPIQFESQQDITDEELQKYLEELEEEEAKEQKLEEAKPSRPDTLNIRRMSIASRQPGSPGQTPLPRGLGSGDFAGYLELRVILLELNLIYINALFSYQGGGGQSKK